MYGPELFILGIPSLFYFGVSCFVLISNGNQEGLRIIRGSLSLVNMLGGTRFFLYFFFILLFWTGAWLYDKVRGDSVRLDRSAQTLKALFPFWLFTAGLSFLWSFSCLTLFYRVTPSFVEARTLGLDHFERNLWGTLPGFFLIKTFSGSLLEIILLRVYKYFFVFSSITVALITLGPLQNLRKVFFAYMLGFVAAFPFWVFFPVTSPDGVYYGKVFSKLPHATAWGPPPTDLSAFFTHQLEYFHRVWIGDRTFLNVSSIPSLHTAWCVILAFYLYRTHKKYMLAALLWALLTAVGTFYSLQHYSTDTFCGVVLAIIVLLTTEKIFRNHGTA